MKKRLFLFLTVIMMLCMPLSSLAGVWKQDVIGWWYENDDGSYTKNAWQTIDGKEYYFNENGYLLVNTVTPDNFQVDENGAKIVSLTDSDNSTQQTTTTASSGTSTKNVETGEYWLSATGNKCHKIPNCGNMNPNKARKITAEEAKNCPKCDKCF